MTGETKFKLTYGTMFNPPEELHTRFEEVLARVRAEPVREYGMFIDGGEVWTDEKFEDATPTDTAAKLGIFQKGGPAEAHAAVEAARKAFPGWSRTPWRRRVDLLRRAADLIDERLYEIGVVMALEVGKNRMEALGDAAESADLIRYSCDRMEANDGFVVQMGRDPLAGFESTNFSVLRPHGVWLVISPFNYPAALTAGPAGAALVTGNTVVLKPATDTPRTARLILDCFRDAGLPEGTVNFVTGPGSTLGQALIEHPDVAGVTFTGSKEVGMGIHRSFARGVYVRPVILELGGKNPTIVSRNADLDDAASGVARSCFGLQGQKCSACSMVYVEGPAYDGLVERVTALVDKFVIGDPTERSVYLGPVINRNSYRDFQDYTKEIREAGGRFLTGGKVLTDGAFVKGYFCAPTFAADLPVTHRLWRTEMFVPVALVTRVESLDEAMKMANDVPYGLTAGFYGTPEETEWFFENIEAGVTYANRPQGSTTGAWPGFQPFGGWKGSGSTGKNAGGLYYLPLYMRESIRNSVRRA